MYFWHKNVLNVKIMTRSYISKVCFLTSVLISLSAQAVTISEYRIYLDEDKRNVSFVIFNRESSHQNCSLSLTHNDFDIESRMTHLENNIIPKNSAKDWIRYSPQEFSLTPGQSQMVRFTMRRKANAQDGEYRSYLLIDCGLAPSSDEKDKTKPQVALQTKLVHSVPIIVRSGRLEASVWIDNIQTSENELRFTLNRKGNRSVYGDIELINKKSGKIIAIQRNFSIYPESERFNFSLNRQNIELNDLKIRFIENKLYGGNIILEKEAL